MLKVLTQRTEIARARARLRARGLSFVEPEAVRFGRRVARKLGLTRSVNMGDGLKSWDVLATIEFLEHRLASGATVLDLGAFASEIVPALDHLGFCVSGVDLDPRLPDMPRGRGIQYEVGDFKHTTFPSDSFSAVTAISVIEHGYEPDALLAEVARLLKPGGVFVASFDYWPDHLDVGQVRPFNMSWLVFSRDDVADLITLAGVHGLRPVGALDTAVPQAAINYAGLDYTFAWLALEKDDGKT